TECDGDVVKVIEKCIGGCLAAVLAALIIATGGISCERDDFCGGRDHARARPDAKQTLQLAILHGRILSDGLTVKNDCLLIPSEAVKGAGSHGPVFRVLGAAREALGEFEIPCIDAKLASFAPHRREFVLEKGFRRKRTQKLKHSR